MWFLSVVFFFFKQKTAYEMRISDWSSDGCSSDLALTARGPQAPQAREKRNLAACSPRLCQATSAAPGPHKMRTAVLMRSTEAVPFPLTHFRTFIADTDPGTRFMMLSAIVRMKCPGTTAKIRAYTRKEYEEVTEELAAALLIASPLTIAAM